MASPVSTPPATPSKRYGAIPAILAAHFEELASLWAIRQEHVCGPDWTIDDLAAWDGRLVAHLDALVAAGDEALPILEEQLAGDDPAAVFAAAFVLLRRKSPAADDRLLRALAEAQGAKLMALADAFSAGPIEGVHARLGELIRIGSPPQSLVAFVALAAHNRLDPKFKVGDDALQSEDPHVRQLAWRCAAHVAPPA